MYQNLLTSKTCSFDSDIESIVTNAPIHQAPSRKDCHGDTNDREYLLMNESFLAHLNTRHSSKDCPCTKCYELSKEIKRLALTNFCESM